MAEVMVEEEIAPGPRPTSGAFAAGVGVLCELLVGTARVGGHSLPQPARVGTVTQVPSSAVAGAEADPRLAASPLLPQAQATAGTSANSLLHLSESRTLRSVLCRLLAAVNLYQADAATVAGHLVRCLELLTRPEVLDGHPAFKSGSAETAAAEASAAAEDTEQLLDIADAGDDDVLEVEDAMMSSHHDHGFGAIAAAFEGHESSTDLHSEAGDSETRQVSHLLQLEQAMGAVDVVDAESEGQGPSGPGGLLEDEHEDEGGVDEASEEGDEDFDEDGEDGEEGELGEEGVDRGELDEEDEAAVWADTDGEDSDILQVQQSGRPDDGISFIVDLGDGRSRVVGRSAANSGNQLNVQDAAGRAFQVLTSLGIPGFGGSSSRPREFTITSRSQHWGFEGELDLPNAHPLLGSATAPAAPNQAQTSGPHGWLALRTTYGFESVTIGQPGQAAQHAEDNLVLPSFLTEAAATSLNGQAQTPSWDVALASHLTDTLPEMPASAASPAEPAPQAGSAAAGVQAELRPAQADAAVETATYASAGAQSEPHPAETLDAALQAAEQAVLPEAEAEEEEDEDEEEEEEEAAAPRVEAPAPAEQEAQEETPEAAAPSPDPTGRDYGVTSLRTLAQSLAVSQERILDVAGIDPHFLEELPLDLRDEIVAQQLSTLDMGAIRQLAGAQQPSSEAPAAGAAGAAPPTPAVAGAAGAPVQSSGVAETGMSADVGDDDSGEISQEILDALPPDIRAEVLADQARERAAAAAPPPADPSQAQDMDTASFIATLTPELRQEVLLNMPPEVLPTLPPELVAEAQLVRERVAQRAARARAVATDHQAFSHGVANTGWLLGGDAPSRSGRSGSGSANGGQRGAATTVVVTNSAGSGGPAVPDGRGSSRGGGGAGVANAGGGPGGDPQVAPASVDLIQILRGHLSGITTTLVRQSNGGSSSRRHDGRGRERAAPPRPDAKTVARFSDASTEQPIELQHSAAVCRLLFLRRSVSRPLMERLFFNLAAHPQCREVLLRRFLQIVIWRGVEDGKASADFPPRSLYGPVKVEGDAADGAELGALEACSAPHVAQQVSTARVLGFLSYLLPRIPQIAEFFTKHFGYRDIVGQVGSSTARSGDEHEEVAVNLLIRHTALDRWPNGLTAGHNHLLLLVLKALLVPQPPPASAGSEGASPGQILPGAAPASAEPASAEAEGGEAPLPEQSPCCAGQLQGLLTDESLAALCNHMCCGAAGGGAEPRAAPVVAAVFKGAEVSPEVKCRIKEELLRYVRTTASGLQATLSVASADPYGVQLHAVGNESIFLQLLQTLQAFYLDVHSAAPKPSEKGAEEARANTNAEAAASLQGFLSEAQVDGVWVALDAAMSRAAEQWVGLEGGPRSGAGSATNGNSTSGGSGSTSAPPPLLHTLLPLIEAFFLVHTSTWSTSQAEHAQAGVHSVPVGDLAIHGDRSLGLGASLHQDDAHSGRSPVVAFGERHRHALNALVRQSPGLLSSSFSSMVESVPWALDFDNKRHYLRQRLRQLRGDVRYDVVRLHVRRSEVFMDSYHQLRMRSGDEMRGKLVVSFVAEEGMDAGGVSREWFKILAREIFNPNYGLFTQAGGKACTFHPSKTSYVNPDHLYFFQFIGRIIGKALFDGHHLEAYFTRSFYKHMLRRKVNYSDMEALDPDYYRNLRWMLDNSIEGVLGHLTFTAESDEFGRVRTVELKPGGASIPVTDSNKREYVQLMCEHKMTKSVQAQIDAFLKGFHELIPPSLISLFDDKELELLISGLPEIDLEDLRRNTEYHNYSENTPQIQWFWKVLGEFSKEHKAWFLQFVTGTSQVPLEGFKGLIGMRGPQKFSIHRAEGGERLPTAHTCFNQLDLPEYSSEELLSRKLVQAVHEAHEGFGFV